MAIQRNVALSIFTPKPQNVPISYCHTINIESCDNLKSVSLPSFLFCIGRCVVSTLKDVTYRSEVTIR